MPENTDQKQLPVRPHELSTLSFVSEVIQGIGLIIGLALLWFLEKVRDVFFRLLDRLNFKARPHRRASAFPPGPRRQNPA